LIQALGRLQCREDKSKMSQDMDIPEGYSEEEWAEYQSDPVGFCIKELRNPSPGVRFNAADILRGMAADAEPAIPALTAGLHDQDKEVREYAAKTLVLINERSRGAT
jgi:hypothetical protein